MDNTNPNKSCTLQHLTTGPNGEWNAEELAAYVYAVNLGIREDDEKLALRYWRLGVALSLLQNLVNHGQWEQLLANLQIEKTRAFRARKIARKFKKESHLAGLTLSKALENRSVKGPGGSSKEESNDLGDFLDHVSKTAEFFIDDAGFVEESGATGLLPAADVAIAKLEQIRS